MCLSTSIFLIPLLAIVISAQESDTNPALQQLPRFKNKTKGPIGILTTSYGSPVGIKDTSTFNSISLIHNVFFMESAAQLVRERIPERRVHAIGVGAFGYFKVTHDITQFCKAKFLNVIGKRTPVAVRFSPVGGNRGGRDSGRGAKGFAVKFYTEEGNFDLVALSTPIFVVKDPLIFPTLVHASGPNPVTNLPDVNSLWDFFTLRPQTMHSVFFVNSDRGVSDGFIRISAFGIHTFQVVNATGAVHFIRFHLHPEGGIEILTPEEAQRIIRNVDANYATRQLYNAIENYDYPTWILYVQVLTLEDVKNADINVFDPTIELPEDVYPLQPVGKLILNKNPKNYFADIEQLAYNPGNLVPGIDGAPDKLFEARCLMYRDGQIYRLGINANNIPVNCPIHSLPLNYLRDGTAPVLANGGGAPNYYPNSFNGPVPREHEQVKLIRIHEDDSINFKQPRNLYNRMSEEERSRFVQNILATLSLALPRLQNKAVDIFTLIDPYLGMRVNQSLQANASQT